MTITPPDQQHAAEMEAWIRKVVGDKHGQNIKMIIDKLHEQHCFSLNMLTDCWDEVKGELPGVPRKLMADAMHKNAVDKIQESFAPVVQPQLWGYAATIALIAIVPGALIGALMDVDFENEGLAKTVMDNAYWYKAWGPLAALALIEFAAASQLGPKIGYDMIEQRSATTDLKEAMRSNMANQAIVGTLLLTIVWAMMQADPPVTKGSNSYEGLFISQWYEGVLIMAVGQLIIAVMTCSFNVLYLEPLDEFAALKFVGDNFSYFGEPLALMLCGLFNSVTASILWMYGSYGKGLGICACIVFFYCITRTTVIYLYLGCWSNPFLDEAEVMKRKEVKKHIAVAGGKLGDNQDLNIAAISPS